MNPDRPWARSAFRFAAWVAIVYVVIAGGALALALALANILIRVLPCQHGKGITLSCPVLGVDFYNVILYSGIVAWFGIGALLIVVPVIAVALIVGFCERASERSTSRAS